MKEVKRIFFHVGLGKTASTYLQYAFFPKIEGIQYIQRTRYRWYPKMIPASQHGTILVSREFDQQLERELRKFAALFPDAKVIIVLRRHDGWIASQYRRYVKNGGGIPFSAFFDVAQDAGLWKQEGLYFYPKLQLIEKYFSQKPLVLFHEELKSDPHRFFRRITDAMGASYDPSSISLNTVHRSYTEKQLKAIRSISSRLFVQNPSFIDNRIINWLQRRTRLLACYIILYSALLIPESWISKAPLIPKDELDQIRNFYEADWKNCKDY